MSISIVCLSLSHESLLFAAIDAHDFVDFVDLGEDGGEIPMFLFAPEERFVALFSVSIIFFPHAPTILASLTITSACR